MKKRTKKPLYTLTTTSYLFGKIDKKEIEDTDAKNKKQIFPKEKSIHDK